MKSWRKPGGYMERRIRDNLVGALNFYIRYLLKDVHRAQQLCICPSCEDDVCSTCWDFSDVFFLAHELHDSIHQLETCYVLGNYCYAK